MHFIVSKYFFDNVSLERATKNNYFLGSVIQFCIMCWMQYDFALSDLSSESYYECKLVIFLSGWA